ncbi:hypothetical protein [Sulfurospirillum oryzae]|uniref:hypothetical protein n=1 Tax=Sulfurospirillum oryzae TaxID=2976535 RepID=UPI0021E870EE|nr:hypothetical protein [Sulfurospirillum oryzae]
MEELEIDRLFESIKELSRSIQKYLQSDELPNVKKELIKKIASSITHKKIFESTKEDFNHIKRKNLAKDEEMFLRDYVLDNNPIIGVIEHTINQIISFKDINFLEFIDEHINHSKSQYQIISSLQLYNDLAEFAHSGIDEKHFPSPEKFKKKVAELQKFSSTIIVLDKFPKHPSQAIREFFLGACFDYPSEIVNKTIDSTKAVFKSEYKKMPQITKARQEELNPYNGDERQMLVQKLHQSEDSFFNLLLDRYRSENENKKTIFKAIADGLKPDS